MRKTKIICTYGPSIASEDMLRKIICAGGNVIRFNFSHGSHDYHTEGMALVKKIRDELDLSVAILMDTKGPEIRTGEQDQPTLLLAKGSTIEVTTEKAKNTDRLLYLDYPDLCRDVSVGTHILIDDGRLKVEVLDIQHPNMTCKVIRGGEIKQKRGVNIPEVELKLPFLSERDKKDLLFAADQGIDIIAASFTRSANDIKSIRSYLFEQKGFVCDIVAKIENHQGVKNIEEICFAADGIMVARGDLGVEMPVENVPKVQKDIIEIGRTMGKPVITATQMLESMIDSARPTRAEVSDVANAIYDSTSAIMLSGETASGQYPIECVELMNDIALKTESDIPYRDRSSEHFSNSIESTKALANAAITTAYGLDISAIVPLTTSGYSARLISRLRPGMDIIAPTENRRAFYKMALYWGVTPVFIDSKKMNDLEKLFDFIIQKVEERKLLPKGSLVILLGGSPVRTSGSTNVLKVSSIGNVATRGLCLLAGQVQGPVHLYKNKASTPDGKILVMRYLLEEDLPVLSQAKGLILQGSKGEELARIAGKAMKIPIVSRCEGAVNALLENESVQLDADKGIVYRMS